MKNRNDKIAELARLLGSLTYDDMMYVARWVSGWTVYDEDGESVYENDEPLLSPASIASGLSDFADQNIDGRQE